MNNIFEQELKKLFGDGQLIDDPTYSGRSCFGTLGRDLRVRAQFITTGTANNYAMELGIEVKTGQKTIERGKLPRQAARKGKDAR